MKKIDPILLLVLSEFWINMGAGWFGVAIIAPLSPQATFPINLWVLTTDVIFGIVSLIIAYKLRKLKEKYDKSGRS